MKQPQKQTLTIIPVQKKNFTTHEYHKLIEQLREEGHKLQFTQANYNRILSYLNESPKANEIFWNEDKKNFSKLIANMST